MRHFFRRIFASQPSLPRGVLGRPLVRTLIFGPSPAQRLTSSNREALFFAVDLPAIARFADADICGAASALKQSKTSLGRRLGPRAGQQTFHAHRGRLILLRANMANIGRNDACACGSGKKYKRCCLAAKPPLLAHVAVRNTPAVMADAPEHLCDCCVEEEINRLADRAADLIMEDRYDDAEAVCHQLMRDYPDEVEGIDLLAMVCEARGETQRALELVRRAIDIADSHPDFDAETRSLMYERQLELETAASPS